jgi:hypothetical protein
LISEYQKANDRLQNDIAAQEKLYNELVAKKNASDAKAKTFPSETVALQTQV